MIRIIDTAMMLVVCATWAGILAYALTATEDDPPILPIHWSHR